MLGATLMLSLTALGVSGLIENMRRAVLDGAFARNWAMGLRTKATKSSDEAWERGHRAALPWLTATVVSTGLTAIGGLVLGVVAAAIDGPAILEGLALGLAIAAYAALMVLGSAAGLVADRAAKRTSAREH